MISIRTKLRMPNSSVQLIVALKRKKTKPFFRMAAILLFHIIQNHCPDQLCIAFKIHNQKQGPQIRYVTLVPLSLTKWRIPHVDSAVPNKIALRLFCASNEIMCIPIFVKTGHWNKQTYGGHPDRIVTWKPNFYSCRERS
jgi:hypothetical protein